MFKKSILSKLMFELRLEERFAEMWEGKVVQPEGTGSPKPRGADVLVFVRNGNDAGGGSREREKEEVGHRVRGTARSFRPLNA